MMDDGPRMIRSFPKIRQTRIAHPEPFRWYSGRRMEMQLLELMLMNRVPLCKDENRVVYLTDVTLNTLCTRVDEIVREVYLTLIMEGSRFNNLDDVVDVMLM
ncbi:hypothetical protein DPMN_039117 [Dreissena polymorpha]|uniref:Uncharacterized protein n=1 Tax=Dreissena polymorpha TaxID=45954 RepID=A0A9D4RRE1_DREPO|nr:hypothetical protein DPMN_039117 [Dreissena polymorpha]